MKILRNAFIIILPLLAACGPIITPGTTGTPFGSSEPIRSTSTATITALFTPTSVPTLITPSATPWLIDSPGSIAYIYGYGKQIIKLLNVDGSNDQILYTKTSEVFDIDPASGLSWSPDGKFIAFSTSKSSDIYLLSTEDSTVRNITNTGDKNFEIDPAWAPNGSKIAFSSNRANLSASIFDIYIMNGDGTNVEQLTNCPSKCFQPSWSPSGEYIAYVSANHPDYDIYVMKANGSEQKRLTQGGMNVHPAWSPDGERIAFIKSVGLKWSGPLYLMNPDGSGMTALTDDSSCVRHMSWSPAGRFIVYEKYCASTLWIMDVQTSKTRPITYGGGAYAPAWSP